MHSGHNNYLAIHNYSFIMTGRGFQTPYMAYSLLLNDIIDLNLVSLGSLVLAAPYCVFYARRHQIY